MWFMSEDKRLPRLSPRIGRTHPKPRQPWTAGIPTVPGHPGQGGAEAQSCQERSNCDLNTVCLVFTPTTFPSFPNQGCLLK